ncbi:MAG: hypothetical protein ACFFG0_06095, partial [Candidatus Thorarchaeota archaeon]
ESQRQEDILTAIPIQMRQLVQTREFISRKKFNLFSQESVDSVVFNLSMGTPKGQRGFAITKQESIKSLEIPGPQQIEIPERRKFITSEYLQRDGSEITTFNSIVSHILAPFTTDPVISANLDPKSGSQSVLVGAPFLEKNDLEYERNKYAKRPGLEFILRLRLRQQNIAEQTGIAIDSIDLKTFQGEISADNQREIAAALSNIGVNNVEISRVLNHAGRVELYTLNDLVKVYKGLINMYVKSLEDIERIRKKIIWVPVANEGGPERGSKVSTIYVKPRTFLDSWEIEHKISQLQVKASLAKLQLEIGETADETPLSFGDFTVSEFQNISKVFDDELQKAENERSQLEAEASNALRIVEYIGGEVSGLGLIDIIAIYIALWSLDTSILLNLIDDSAAIRLNSIKELKTAETESRASRLGNAKEAYESFAERVQTILSYGDMLYQQEFGSPNEKEGGDVVRDPF